MRLSDYLAARGETPRAFAARVGITGQAVRRIADGGWPQLRIANEIVKASQVAPAPDGATVTLLDLIEAAQEAAGEEIAR